MSLSERLGLAPDRALDLLDVSVKDHDGMLMKFQKGGRVYGLYPGDNVAGFRVTTMVMKELAIDAMTLTVDWNECMGIDQMTTFEKELLVRRLKEFTARLSNNI